MIQRGSDGKLSGFDADLAKEIAAALGVDAKFVAAGSKTSDVIELVASGEADIGLSYLSESVEAAKRVFFSRPYMIETHTVFVNRVKGIDFAEDCPRVSDLLRLARSPDQLGVLGSSPYAKLLRREEAGSKARLFEDMKTMVNAAASGDIVASLQGELSAKYYLSRNPEITVRLMFCSVPKVQHRVSIAVRPDALGLLRWLDVYLAQRGTIIDLDSLLFRPDREVY